MKHYEQNIMRVLFSLLLNMYNLIFFFLLKNRFANLLVFIEVMQKM